MKTTLPVHASTLGNRIRYQISLDKHTALTVLPYHENEKGNPTGLKTLYTYTVMPQLSVELTRLPFLTHLTEEELFQESLLWEHKIDIYFVHAYQLYVQDLFERGVSFCGSKVYNLTLEY